MLLCVMKSSQSAIFKKLLEAAHAAAKRTYSPYSKYPVGAAVVTTEGQVFTGCNVENASFGGTICAERTALVKAISEGHTKFQSMAIVCSKAKNCWPCGICRQFLCEFGVELDIVVEDEQGEVKVLKLKELLPNHFGPDKLPI
jgi:cytidine deaminase